MAYLTTSQIELRYRCLNFNGEPPFIITSFTTHDSIYNYGEKSRLVLRNEGF